jgi:hypothetical protein
MKLYLLMGLFALLFGSKAPTAEVQILPLSTAQSKELTEQAIAGAEMLKKYLGTSPTYTPAQVDDAIVSWSRSKVKDKEAPDRVVELLGAYFGNYLAQKFELEWKVYRDNQGPDLCVIHKKVSVFSFPHSAVYKAALQGRQHALAEVESTLAKQIKEGLGDPSIQTR